MRGRRRGERMGVNGEINVVSLIDVMMLLMVIFMITAPIMQGGVEVNLPKADVRPLDAKNGLVITIDRNGRIFVDRTAMTLQQFAGSIKALNDKKGGGGVSVSADRDAKVDMLVKVMGALTAAGITQVGLVGEPEARP
jgi:biopolymer transport protein ExbD/biopolymer transport protein TolR